MEHQEDRVNHVLAQLLNRRDQGDPIDLEAVIAEHPDVCDDVRSFLEMDRLLEVALGDVPTVSKNDGSTIDNRIAPPPGYSIVRELGHGGMGVVYGAIHLPLGRRVALKALPQALAKDPARIARFRQEASAASRLTSSRVLSVFDVLEHNGCLFIVTPWIEGTDLARVLRQRRARERGDKIQPCHALCTAPDEAFLTAALRLCDQAIEALVAIHEAGVIHRDIKPSNILIDERGDVWVADFGLAKLADEQGMTATGDVLGTRGYMSPEQLKGASDIDFRTDVFSLGVTIYETLTGRLPYESAQVDEGSLPPLPPSRHQRLLSADYDAVLLKAIDPARVNRYDAAAKFQEDWAKVRQGLLPAARRPSVFRTASRWISRRRWLVATGALGGACLGLSVSMLPERPLVYQVEVPTSPRATRGVLVPIHPDTGEVQPSRKIDSRSHSADALVFYAVPPGDYVVVVEAAEHGFHEVLRHVPEEGEMPLAFRHRDWKRVGTRKLRLHEVVIPRSSVVDEMVPFGGATAFRVGIDQPPLAALAPHDRKMDAFYLDVSEVSYQQCVKASMSHLLPQGKTPVNTDWPMSNVTFDQAIEYAELLGKRLPTEFEYEFCATNAGTTRYPWGDDSSLATSDAFGCKQRNLADRTAGDRSVQGLFSGVAEWTSSWGLPYPTAPQEVIDVFRQHADYRQLRVVRGGPSRETTKEAASGFPEIALGPRYRVSLYRSDRSLNLGFRCARSAVAPYLSD